MWISFELLEKRLLQGLNNDFEKQNLQISLTLAPLFITSPEKIGGFPFQSGLIYKNCGSFVSSAPCKRQF